MPELNTSIFLIPGEHVKNGEERLVVLNRVAMSVIEALRGVDPAYVFVRKRKDGKTVPIAGINNTAWKGARERAPENCAESHGEAAPQGFRKIRVHEEAHIRPATARCGRLV